MARTLCFAFLCLIGILQAEDTSLRAGAAMSNITPEMGVPLDGTIMQIGPARAIHDELWVRCLVLNDSTTTLAFAIVDSTSISREIHDAAKQQIEKELGIPPSHVCIAATHTHSTPRAKVDLIDNQKHRDYLDWLAVRIADGVRRAHQKLQPAEVAHGSFEEPRFVHNRRWFVKSGAQSPFGDKAETVKMNPGRDPNILNRPSGPVDPEVYVLAVRNSENKQPIALLGNYGLHYVGGIPTGTVSSDYFGVYAELIEGHWTDNPITSSPVAMMSNGTSGDVNAHDFTKPRPKDPPFARMNFIGTSLAESTLKLASEFSWKNEITLDAAASELEFGIRKPDEERLAWARQTKAPDNTRIRLTRPQVYAREALLLAEYPDTVSIPVQAFRIGDLAIAQSPCETFAATGLAIKEGSPFPGNTFTIELANGYAGYLPPEEQFEYGGYETWPARSSFLEEPAEGVLREEIFNLLNQLKERTP